MSTILYPKYCTIKEGGDWIKCPNRYTVTLEALNAKEFGMPMFAFKITLPAKTRSGYWNYRVHSFIFAEPTDDHCPRWDSTNGWTTEL